MEGLIMLGQLLLAVLIIAGIHEWGHMLAARIFGIRVEQFSIGFPPRLFAKTWKGTTYILGLIPLGGYVKLSGMVDESMDVKSMESPPKPYEFRSKPAWQRMIVMLGGIIMNLITGVVVFAIMSYVHGESYLPRAVVEQHGVEVGDLGKQLGLRTGDKIVSLNGVTYTRFTDLIDPKIFLSENTYYEVLRDGVREQIFIPANFAENFSSKSSVNQFMSVRTTFKVREVIPGSAAAQAGLVSGDSILRFANQPVRYFDELRNLIKVHANQSVVLEVARKDTRLNTQALLLTCHLQGDTLGIVRTNDLPYVHRDYTLPQSFVMGGKQALSLIVNNALGIAKMVKGHVSPSKSLAGPIGIAQMFGGHWQWGRFFYLLALISVFVAIFNLLPIPALDGGHVLFCTYEMITGQRVPVKVLHHAQTIGMVLLIGFDVLRLAKRPMEAIITC